MTEHTDLLIETNDLGKRYGERIVAVDELNLNVRRGEVYGFLGPNGAGKTTTLRMLLGLIRPTTGTALVLDAAPGTSEALGRLGALIETPTFYPYLSGRDNLRVLARYAGVPEARIASAIDQVDLTARAGDRFRTYSLGMKQRLGIAAVLLKDPELLILDEPTNGMDPAGMAEMRPFIRSLGQGKRTVLLSSHLMSEVEQVCDRVGVISQGRLVGEGTVAELLLLAKRASTWILLAIWAALALTFAYVVPYVQYTNDPSRTSLSDLLPESLVGTLMAGFPFFGGVLALMLGVLTVGSEYGWGTLKTLFTQGPGRLQVFGAKLIAVSGTLALFVLVVYALGAVARWAIAASEGADAAWPSAWLLARGLAGGWLIFAAWAALGMLLAIVTRGTALATGIGILYAFVVEGLLSALAGEISLLDGLVEFFLRANGYSLVAVLGVSAEDVSDRGPGSFSGPFVAGGQALLILAAYTAVFVVAAGWLLRRRDVA